MLLKIDYFKINYSTLPKYSTSDILKIFQSKYEGKYLFVVRKEILEIHDLIHKIYNQQTITNIQDIYTDEKINIALILTNNSNIILLDLSIF